MNLSAFGPLLGNISLVFLFAQALINPTANKDFIDNTSFFYFFIELATLAASMVLIKFKLHPEDLGLVLKNNTLYDRALNNLRYLSIICFFSLGTFLIGYLTNQWFIPILFTISLASKAYAKSLVANEKNMTVYAIIFGISYFFTVYSAVIWGIVYFSLLTLFEMINTYRNLKIVPVKIKK